MKVLLIGERSLFIILSLKILVFQIADFSKAENPQILQPLNLYVENSQFLNIDKMTAQFLEAKNSIFSTGYNSNLNSMHRLSRGGTFTNCTIHGYQLGKWGSDGGTIKNSILVNGHINGIPTQGGGWDVTYSVRANVGSGDIGATFGEGDVSLSSIEDVLFIDISSGNEVNPIIAYKQVLQ